MTHKLKKTLLRGMCLTALAGIGLVATPGTARADFIDFQVVEGAVPGTPTNTFTADKLNGGYNATLTLAATSVGGVGTCPVGAITCGTWTETATADFSQYYLNNVLVAGTQYISDSEPEGYLVRGALESEGTYVQAQCQFSTDICFFFTFTSQTGTLTLDADSVLGGDTLLLTASGVAAGTTGSLRFDSTGSTLLTGSFNSNFLNNTLAANATAQAYWPTLALTQFTTTINGDLDQTTNINTNPVLLGGDVSVQFTAVPEPATLTLLSLGLAAGARHIRRRRRAENI